MDLSTVRNRDRLKAQREPYWHKLDKGQFIGYRPSKVGGPGSWIARWYDAEHWRNRFRALGEYGDLPPSERYGAAMKDAREWFDHVS
ncbi:MAG: integrase, partial [Proteobacteria bacterium]|nr:integrase [Pseudomonadota bacterium]